MYMQHFLQTDAWRQFQQTLGREYFTDSGDGWSYTAYLEKGAGNTRLYAPYGPTIDSPEAFSAAIASLKSKAKQHDATFLRIEPTYLFDEAALRHQGFQPVTYQQLNPAHTLVIDLSIPEDELLMQMSQNSRNLTRNYAKKGLALAQSRDPDDISILTSLLKGVASRNKITPHSDEYFKKQAAALFPLDAARLFYMTLEGKPIAAALVYDSETTRYYAHAAADDTYRKLSAGTALVGQMILEAKSRGLSHFDLYGIAPPNQPNHPWHGFTKFKRSFGGEEVRYSGAWDLPLKPLSYRSYRVYQQLRRRLK
jgi:lipid II:glycine glycyltransferase (peptidoglycan interpeptide bridge formation enzyme)